MTTPARVIDKKIVSVEAVRKGRPARPEAPPGDSREKADYRIVRPAGEPTLGVTYKLRWPPAGNTIYMTANFVKDEEGRKLPFELFFVGGDPETHDMLKVVGRTVSSIFQRGGDVRFVIKDFVKEVSPQGAFVQPMGFTKPFHVRSLSAYIGFTLLDFFHRCGFPGLRELCKERKIFNHSGVGNPSRDDGRTVSVPGGTACPDCGEPAVIKVSGCPTCQNCGSSKC